MLKLNLRLLLVSLFSLFLACHIVAGTNCYD